MSKRMWASRDRNSETVKLWREKPDAGEHGTYVDSPECDRFICYWPKFGKHDLKTGECCEIEPIKLVRKAKKRSVKRGKEA